MPTHTKARNARILVVTGDPQIQKLLKSILTVDHYQALLAANVASAIQTQAPFYTELVILDLDATELRADQAIIQIRRYQDAPMIVLSDQHREADVVAALDLGADDYIEKPFRSSELLARVRSVLRRSLAAHGETAVYHCGALDVDIVAHGVTRSGEPIRLTPTEFEILSLLVRNRGRVVPYNRFLALQDVVRHCTNKQALRTFIWSLRQKIEDTPQTPRMVLTEKGIGYRLARSLQPAITHSDFR
jgi:two-component system KDP operon response regulator KdpE